jgi:tRNA(adenine34) deaminase
MINARLGRVVYGCHDQKGGAETLFRLLSDSRLNHRVLVTSGVCAEACANILSQFFSLKRKNKRDEQNGIYSSGKKNL